jgi:hypothetical protein
MFFTVNWPDTLHFCAPVELFIYSSSFLLAVHRLCLFAWTLLQRSTLADLQFGLIEMIDQANAAFSNKKKINLQPEKRRDNTGRLRVHARSGSRIGSYNT